MAQPTDIRPRSLRLAAVGALAALAVLALAAATTFAQKSPVPEKVLPSVTGAAAVQPAVTVFVDISGKRAEAAAKLTATHAEMAKRGYIIVGVFPHIENNDLQGFFATYTPAR